ncbi:exodeoxyribonuclease V subunit alpha [Buchnera aphidicola (Thelaxes californica)]|uniref:RecBCD enzyme subunit RecD n=1 Tax=Buchnera aphidicola (Thelaxes californica) TaxID=1315998 RepID=A0A4D6YFJ2_9GAMM|nr:exodeoxyribonuclease V subunit alpha [Buchnera aphidicola]QCI26873.1 exodeoxyribonuclease V subunit alpha [Buchnera aphidicola (Thelaxes californica)]
MNIQKILHIALKKKMINNFEFYFSTTLFHTNQPEIILAALCVCYNNRMGNICLNINKIQKKNIFPKKFQSLTQKIWTYTKHIKNWKKHLKKIFFLNQQSNFPLFLSNNYLYTRKMWVMELYLSHFFFHKNLEKKIKIEKTKKIISVLSKENIDNNQIIAITLALLKRIVFIIGSPGTGKTTIVTKLILCLIRLYNKKNRIKLCAPTGKAATRLVESIQESIKSIFLITNEEKKQIPTFASTIHELINVMKKKDYTSNNIENILIIDEASMIDIYIFYELIKNITKSTRIIFIGDINQLPSVQPGSILKDICKKANNTYNLDTCNKIYEITKKKVKQSKNIHPQIYNNIYILKKNYRFSKSSNIHQLANLIHKRKINELIHLLDNTVQEIEYFQVTNQQQYNQMIYKIINFCKKYLKYVYENLNYKKILTKFNKFKILCAVNEGIFGVNTINKIIEKTIYKQKNKFQYLFLNKEWYIGRPIIITKNQKILNIFNGEIGIALKDKNEEIKIHFSPLYGKQRIFCPDIIQNYKTAWCITVHKSQGSEFSKVCFVIPNIFFDTLSTELMYTAVTRAKKKIIIFGNKTILKKMVQNNTIRTSNICNIKNTNTIY